jgi:hypothetical protein
MKIVRYISKQSPNMDALMIAASHTGKWKVDGVVHQITGCKEADKGMVRIELESVR